MALTVVDSYPLFGYLTLAIDSELWLSFSDEVDDLFLTNEYFTLIDIDNNIKYGLSLTKDAASPDKIIIKPEVGELNYETNYRLIIKAGLVSVNSEELASDYILSFKTIADATIVDSDVDVVVDPHYEDDSEISATIIESPVSIDDGSTTNSADTKTSVKVIGVSPYDLKVNSKLDVIKIKFDSVVNSIYEPKVIIDCSWETDALTYVLGVSVDSDTIELSFNLDDPLEFPDNTLLRVYLRKDSIDFSDGLSLDTDYVFVFMVKMGIIDLYSVSMMNIDLDSSVIASIISINLYELYIRGLLSFLFKVPKDVVYKYIECVLRTKLSSSPYALSGIKRLSLGDLSVEYDKQNIGTFDFAVENSTSGCMDILKREGLGSELYDDAIKSSQTYGYNYARRRFCMDPRSNMFK